MIFYSHIISLKWPQPLMLRLSNPKSTSREKIHVWKKLALFQSLELTCEFFF